MSSPDVVKRLNQSFSALQQYFSPSRKQEGTGNPSQLVLFAEHAAKNGCGHIASESLELYHTLDPPVNQFLIRAHLCKAVLIADIENTGANLPEVKLGQALDFIVKAVSIASKSECYFFLIYNASVLIWKICRPFQRPEFRRLFARPLRAVVKALDEHVQQEYTWKLELYMNLILSQLDAGLKEEACRTCTHAIVLANKHVPDKLVDLVRLQASHNLGDSKIISKETRQSSPVMFLLKLNKIRYAIHYNGLCGTDLEQKLHKLFKTGYKVVKSARKSESYPLGESHSSIFLEAAMVCLENSQLDLMQDCLHQLPRNYVQGSSTKNYLHQQLLQTQLTVARGSNSGTMYTKKSMDTRLDVISELEEILKSALRLSDPDLIERVCVALWNISLPMLQHNLCHLLAKPLTLLASALEDISSLFYEMRLTVHLELAKISAQSHLVKAALDHLDKAMVLDINEKYTEQIKHHKHKFSLRAMIYAEPESSVDKAAKMMQQCEDLTNNDSNDELAPLLVKVGKTLAPNFFSLALNGSPIPRDPIIHSGSDLETNPDSDLMSQEEIDTLEPAVREALTEKGGKLRHYQMTSRHVKRFLADQTGSVDINQWCQLWGVLAKIARKNGVWDVARTAATFCLAYNEKDSVKSIQSKSTVTERFSSPLLSQRMSSASSKGDRTNSSQTRQFQLVAEPSHADESRHKEDLSLLRTVAEVHCLLAECFIYQLQQENLSLGQKPCISSIGAEQSPSVMYIEKWLSYVEWASSLSKAACEHFLKASKIGVFLGETHIVNNAAVYLWNYNQHLIQSNTLVELVPTFRSLLASMRDKFIKRNTDKELVVRTCTLLTRGIVKKWMPVHNPNTPLPSARSGKKSGKKEARSGKKKAAGDGMQVDPEGLSELKEAVEVCDYGLSVGGGISMSVRKQLLAVWVQCKQLLRQPITPGSYDITELNDGCTKECRALVAMEILGKQGSKIWEFPNPPSLQAIFSLLCDCVWTDYLLELEIWTILAQLALESMNYDLVIQCTTKAITVQHKNNSRSIASVSTSLNTLGSQSSARANDSDTKLESELMSLTYSFQGQALLASSGPGENISVVRRALDAFLDSARFGYDAGNYEFVISASSRYWNCSLSLSKDPMEHVLLRDPLSELLNMIAPLLPHRDSKKNNTSEKKDLLVSMYGMVFQAYIDKNSWEDGLKTVEKAFSVMPKFLHRYLVHYRLIFKSRLGRSVESDMIKVQDESELILSSLWHTAALNAKIYPDKLQAYQQCIQVLKPGNYPWIRTSYLLELGEWLYQQSQFPVQDALDQFQLVVNTLLNLREKPAPKDDLEGGEGGDIGFGDIDGEEGAMGGGGTEEGVIASSPSHLSFPLPSTICNVTQLDTLLRIHVMMSQLHGIGSQEHWDLSVAALAYCSLIWKLVYASFVKFDEGTKPGQHPSLPTNTKDWAEFQVPNQILEYLKESEDIGSINKMTVKKPVLTLYYLDILVQSLLHLGLHPLTLPVLNLELAIAVTTLSHTAAFTKLLHMRIASICLELDVLSALPIHKEASVLIPDDQASSHVEMALFQAKREALDREESRRTLIALKSIKSAKNVTLPAESPDLLPSPEIIYQAYCVGDDILVREVWVRQAHLLIQQGQYSTARQLLDSARMESESFDDHHTLFLVYINSGLLAMAEKDTDAAVLSFAKALSLRCQLESLLDGVLHLSKAILGSDEHRSQHVQVLEHITNLVKKIGKKYSNTSPILTRTTELLQSRVSVYSLADLVEGPLTTHAKDKIHQLCTAIDDSTDLLLKWGLYREASALLKLAGGSCMKMAKRLHSMEYQHYILKSLSLYRKALQSLQTCYMKVISVCHPLKEVTLPVETELVGAQLNVAEVLLLIFTENSTETKNARKIHQEKSSIQKVIDDYVRESVFPLVENKWLSEATVACDRVLNLLTSAFSMAKSNRKLKAKCTYLLGQCFSVMSEHANPDPSEQWEELPVVPQKPESPEGDSMEEEQSAQLIHNNYSTVSMVVRQQEASSAEIEESTSLKFMYQAVHGLAEAIAMAVTSEQWELGMTAAMKMVDCIGIMDPSLSSQYLAFYQSLSFSVEMLHFLRKLQSSPDTSTLGALLCQREELAAHGSYESPIMESNNTLLSSFVAFKSLSVTTNHLELLRSFPSYFRFVVLQHSPDMTKLYAAYLIPPQQPPPSAHKKAQQPTEIDPLEPAISSVQVSPNDLYAMEEMMVEYQEAVHQSMCSPIAIDNGESILTDLSFALECYLAKVLKPISIALSKENSSKELSVVILADTHLLSLPLETLPLFHKDNICSVSRDFSLQMLQHKLPKGSREVSGKTSEMKKREKHANLPPSSLPAVINGFKYIFDPNNSMVDGEDNNHSSKILAQIHSFPKLTGKWTGFNSTDTTMGLSEWPPLLKEASGFIFFGTEKFLSHLPPNILVSLNLPGCSFAMIMDSMSTPHSTGKQKNKSNEQLYYESPVQTAMLLRMAGVGSMMVNQWHTSVENNVIRTNAMIKELLTENKTVGKVHWLTKTKEKDTSSQESIFAENSITYNCVLYGLPHLTLQ